MSRELILVRHAIAFERNQRRWPDDNLRPLTETGRQKFRRATAGLAQCLPKPDRVLTRPLVRARQTADILRETARWPKARKQKARRIAVVGHEPDLPIIFKKGGVASVQFEREVRPGAGTLLAFVPPRALRRMRGKA